MSLPKVLFADDEAKICEYFQLLLSDEATVMTATTIDEALSIYASQGPFDAVVCDYRFDHPGEKRTGLDLLATLELNPEQVFIALCSAYNPPESKLVDTIMYYPKPFDEDVILEDIKVFIDNRN